MDNSKCHNGSDITEILSRNKVIRAPHPHPHPPYSPDISPNDFWFFGETKRKMKDRQFQVPKEIKTTVEKVWNDFTFDDIQKVFCEWCDRLKWVAGHGGEYFIR